MHECLHVIPASSFILFKFSNWEPNLPHFSWLILHCRIVEFSFFFPGLFRIFPNTQGTFWWLNLFFFLSEIGNGLQNSLEAEAAERLIGFGTKPSLIFHRFKRLLIHNFHIPCLPQSISLLTLFFSFLTTHKFHQTHNSFQTFPFTLLFLDIL